MNRVHAHTVLCSNGRHRTTATTIPCPWSWRSTIPTRDSPWSRSIPPTGSTRTIWSLTLELRDHQLPALMKDSASGQHGVVALPGHGRAATDQAPMDLGMPPGPPDSPPPALLPRRRAQPAVWDRFHAYADDLAASGKGRGRVRRPVPPHDRRHRHLHRPALVNTRVVATVVVLVATACDSRFRAGRAVGDAPRRVHHHSSPPPRPRRRQPARRRRRAPPPARRRLPEVRDRAGRLPLGRWPSKDDGVRRS